MVEIQIVRTETIKPSSPTPDALKRFSLSVFDQIFPSAYSPVVLFYPAGGQSSYSDRITKLKLSLSKALVRFYPVAGRLVMAENYVDCNDAGVDFVEAKVNGCRLSDILGCPDDEVVGKLLPAESGSQTLMRVQANVLECGGMGIGLCFSHAIMDACAIIAFLKAWTAAARGDEEFPAPDLNVIASRFPAVAATIHPPEPEVSQRLERRGACKYSTRRFVFQATKIAALKDKSSSAGTERPTRLGAVSALIWKCIVNSLTKNSGQETKPSVVSQTMNVRARVVPPLSENSLGNMVVSVPIKSDDNRNDLQRLASKLSQGLRDATHSYLTKSGDSKAVQAMVFEGIKKFLTLLTREDINFYVFTSWCRFEWYELDFGWGNPTWICPGNPKMKNVVVLTDTRDGDGIEVMVTLPEQDMIFFETDHELLEFGILNPSVCP